MPAAVVTGVSSGIGAAIAADLAGRGWRVFGTVRRMADADRLGEALGARFTPLIADVTDAAAMEAAAAEVAAALGEEPLAGLVCNAGISLPGPLLHQPLEELDRQWAVNVRGVIVTVRAFAGLLGAREGFSGRPGRIVTMSSVQGGLVWPFVVGYAVSKHALEAVSHGFRRELMPFGIDVIIVAPGPVATPIWEKSAAGVDRTRYERTVYGPLIAKVEGEVAARLKAALPAAAVAETVHTALTHPRPRTRYTVTGARLRNWTGPRLLPDRLLDRIVAGRLGLGRRR